MKQRSFFVADDTHMLARVVPNDHGSATIRDESDVSRKATAARELVVGLLQRTRIISSAERDVHEVLARVFADGGVSFAREVALSKTDRIDFLIEGVVGVEVKVDGSLSSVTRQLHRYAQHERIRELVLVTTLMRHRALPTSFGGKPIHVVHIGSPF